MSVRLYMLEESEFVEGEDYVVFTADEIERDGLERCREKAMAQLGDDIHQSPWGEVLLRADDADVMVTRRRDILERPGR